VLLLSELLLSWFEARPQSAITHLSSRTRTYSANFHHCTNFIDRMLTKASMLTQSFKLLHGEDTERPLKKCKGGRLGQAIHNAVGHMCDDQRFFSAEEGEIPHQSVMREFVFFIIAWYLRIGDERLLVIDMDTDFYPDSERSRESRDGSCRPPNAPRAAIGPPLVPARAATTRAAVLAPPARWPPLATARPAASRAAVRGPP
jgi:hypothetical protein